MSTERFMEAQRRLLAAHGAGHVRSRFIEVDVGAKVRTQVLEAGEGEPVVFVHGGGGAAAGWAPLMARIEGARLLAPDRPGGGGSDGFDYRGVDLRRHAVAWLAQVLDALEVESAVFVANSMGARWTTWFALEHPGRVRGIAALGMPAFLLDTSAPMPLRLMGKEPIGRLMMALDPPSPAQARRLWTMMGHPEASVTPELAELTAALGEAPSYARTFRSLLGACLRLSGAAPGMSSDAAQLAALSMPIAFGLSASDPFGALEAAEAAARHAPDATVSVAGVGHLPWLDDPAEYARIVRALMDRADRSVSHAA